MSLSTPPVWTPAVTTLPTGALVRITAVRADEIVFDRVAQSGTDALGQPVYQALSTAHAVPFSGYAPETDPLPDLATVAAAIATPAAVPVPVPASVTPRQLRLQLLALGVTDAMVRAQLAGDEAALIEWEFTQEIKRAHPLVAQLGAALGLDSAQIDAAFHAAAQL